MLVHQHGRNRQGFLHGEVDGGGGSVSVRTTASLLLKQARSEAADRRGAPRLRFFDSSTLHRLRQGAVYKRRAAAYILPRIAFGFWDSPAIAEKRSRVRR